MSDQPLSERADEIAARSSRAMADCWEIGMHPRSTPINVDIFNQLAQVVVALAHRVDELASAIEQIKESHGPAVAR